MNLYTTPYALIVILQNITISIILKYIIIIIYGNNYGKEKISDIFLIKI